MFFSAEMASVFVSVEIIQQFMEKRAARSESQVLLELSSPELLVYKEVWPDNSGCFFITFRKIDLVDKDAIDNHW